MKLAVVIPWFGRELKGGAEQQAWQIASRLAQRGHELEVLTTCCRSHQDDWSTNHLPEGSTKEPEGFTIRRFPVEVRDREAFDRICGKLLRLEKQALRPGVPPVPADESKVFVGELIKSPRLLEFIAEQKDEFDRFILLPYLYGPILEAVTLLGDKAALQPCLHDEAYAYLPEVARAFYEAGSLFFNSAGEMELAARLYGPGILPKSCLVGEGVEVNPQNGAGNVPSRPEGRPSPDGGLQPDERFVLYLGRKDPEKNVDLLLRAFARFRAVRPNSPLQLRLAGYGSMDGLVRDGAVDLGLVSEEQKEQLLRECVALVQPSQNESFSRVMMEAWFHGKPVAVHSDCLATAVAVRTADGGWSARDETDWARFFVEFDRTREEELTRRGENGRRYAQIMADWDRVMERYEEAFSRPVDSSLALWRRAENARIEINQFLPNLSFGDAISNHALLIRNYLRGLGYRARIFVRFVDPRVAEECEVFSPEAVHASDAIIYHHSIGTEITPEMMNYPGPKCMIYHNITPAGFFETYRPEFAAILRKGRDDLHKLRDFTISVGDSSYNAQELEECGFENPGVLPICVDPAHWAFAPDPALMERLQDGRTNLLFVGRIAPNKKQNDLVYALRDYRLFDPTARLILVGTMETGDPFAAHLQATIDLLGLNDFVTVTGNISGPELEAYYRTAHLFWSMSEHEGFCVPLVEAMWFDLPVLAFRSSAVPETLGAAAMMFTDKSDYRETAALAYLLVHDQELRAKVIAAQRRQRETFLPAKIGPLITEIATTLQTEARRVSRRPRLRSDGSVAEVDQFLPNLSHGDAISNHAFLIRDSLRASGFRSKILVRYREHALAMECEVFTEEALESSPAIIYHHSIGTEITPHLLAYKGAKALIYHNITPAHFYDAYSPEHAARLRQGREELHRMGQHFPVSFGVSQFNATELEECGFRDPGVFPLAVDPYRLSGFYDQQLLASLQDGRTNLLFVGRVTPNKKQDDLLRAFAAYRKLEPGARLIMVGDAEASPPYSAHLNQVVSKLKLGESVLRPGNVSDAQLAAYYRSAHLFWSMSEHEGFCVPLVEAMWFDLPVLAFHSSAVPETLGQAGVMFSDKSDLAAVAALAYDLVHDAQRREKVIASQQKRRLDYLPRKLAPLLEKLAVQLSAEKKPVRARTPGKTLRREGKSASAAPTRSKPTVQMPP
ncbi:MAG: hypothetical protein QOH88_3248 [Verrucomicrobiota bacterium]|jgi:glycosyltransferase involved in cell wall biosynthesis